VCGIAGFAGYPPGAESDAEERVRAMCQAIRHRGPDGEGYFTEGGVALGMRRLSIIDLAGGWQPIASEDGRVQVVFNGEIYNHRILRDQLTRAGHSFRTRSDTEVIVHGYEEWGDRVLDELRGMFAIALWDRGRGRLLLARDRLGIKPLYLWEQGQALAFASELKCFERLPGFPREVEGDAILGYLSFGYVPDPQAIWKGMRKLPPGHALAWSASEGSQERQWWSPLVAENPSVSEGEAIEETRRLLEEAVGCHLEADVPLGAFLSGGVDSSAVVSQMARLMDRKVQTFSIGFADPAYNEAPDAALVASAIGTDHVERILHPDVDELVDDLLLWFDEPFADASALPTWLVSKLAREVVTVALSGDGGDELFGGYTRYQEVQRLGLEAPLVRRMAGAVARRLPQGAYGRGLLLNLSRSTQGRYASTVGLPALPSEGGVVKPEVAGEHAELEALLSEAFARTAGRDLGSQMSLVDVMGYLPGDILTKVDRMSMKVSLEARVPLLDHKLVEFALSLPGKLKFRNGSGKWVFRQAVKDLVPPAVLVKKKQGFGVPIAEWLRGPLRHRLEALAELRSPIYRFCDEAAVRRLLGEHSNGRRDHNTQLWRLIVLDIWLRAHKVG
jgi:asparagine synthase (glutamine-hydrolysing)